MSDNSLTSFIMAAGLQQQQQQLQQQQSQQQKPTTPNSNWILNQLSQYFDVTTTDVVERIIWSAIPFRKTRPDVDSSDELMAPLTDETMSSHVMMDDVVPPSVSSKQTHYSYMERFIQSRPDFYGPFWISTTLVFIIATVSNIMSLVHHSLESEQLASAISQNKSAEVYSDLLDSKLDKWHYSMDELNMSSSLIMMYLAMVPTFFWFLFWFRGCSKFYTLAETICAYGYSLSIFIPLALMLAIQATLIRYTMIILASALSGGVLLLSFLPVAKSDPNPASSHIILAFVPLCQLGLAYVIHRIMLQ
jgi:hypothetical protein